jgi:hypothetical protein
MITPPGGTMPDYHFERALFIVGEPDSGKSTQIRSMFQDVRLGTKGDIPTANKLPDTYRLANDRCLYVRIMSPHEANESLDEFLEKTEGKLTRHLPDGKRWNFVSPLQPNAANRMPDVRETCRAFVQRFNPERTRVVFLSPDRHGTCTQNTAQLDLAPCLRDIPSVEMCWVDARDRTANGLLLADFFDFT